MIGTMVSRWAKDTFHARLNPRRFDRDQRAGKRMLDSRPEGPLPTHHGPLGWRRLYRTPRSALGTLWHAPSPNARFLIVSGSFWTANLAATELKFAPEEIAALTAASAVRLPYPARAVNLEAR